MRAQKGVVGNPQGQAEGFRERFRPGPALVRAGFADHSGRAGQRHHLNRAIRGGDLPDQQFATLGQADQFDAFTGKDLLQRGRDHAAVPRTPVDADRTTARPAARLVLGQFVEHLVGHGIVGLAGASETAGGGGEQRDETEIITGGRGQQRAQPADLGAVDLGKLLAGLVHDQTIGQYAGAMDDAPDRTVLPANLRQQRADGVGVADIYGAVKRFTSGSLDSGQGSAQFASGQNRLILLFNRLGMHLSRGVVEDGPLDAALFGQRFQPGRFGSQFRAASQQHQ